MWSEERDLAWPGRGRLGALCKLSDSYTQGGGRGKGREKKKGEATKRGKKKEKKPEKERHKKMWKKKSNSAPREKSWRP